MLPDCKACILQRRCLGAMGAVGLLFEAPVALSNVREIMVLIGVRGEDERRTLKWLWTSW